MLLTEGLPVVFIPKEFLSFGYLFRLATIQGFFKPVRLDVIHNGSGHSSSLLVTHFAERVRPEECEPGFVPSAVIDAWLNHVGSPLGFESMMGQT